MPPFLDPGLFLSELVPQHHHLGGGLGELSLELDRPIRQGLPTRRLFPDRDDLGPSLGDDAVRLRPGFGEMFDGLTGGLVHGDRDLGRGTDPGRFSLGGGFDLLRPPGGPFDDAVLGVEDRNHGVVERGLLVRLGRVQFVLHLGEALLGSL